MLGRPEVGTLYRTGKDGARVVYRDGRVSQHAPFSLVMFQWHPLKIEGAIYSVTKHGLGYEAPSPVSREVK